MKAVIMVTKPTLGCRLVAMLFVEGFVMALFLIRGVVEGFFLNEYYYGNFWNLNNFT